MSHTADTHILQTQLAALAAARTPLHMPGHKRQVCPCPGAALRLGPDRD